MQNISDTISSSKDFLIGEQKIIVNFELGKIQVGDKTYKVKYGKKHVGDLPAGCHEIMTFVKDVLTKVGKDLNVKELNHIKITSTQVTYTSGTTALSEEMQSEFCSIRKLVKKELPQTSSKLDSIELIKKKPQQLEKKKPLLVENQKNDPKIVLGEYFKLVLKEGKTVENAVENALEKSEKGKDLMQVIIKGNSHPPATMENLRAISWYLIVKSIEQGEFLSLGSIRFQDKEDKVFNWMKSFEGKGLYRRISTHYLNQSATTEKKNFLGLSFGPMLQPNQYGIEDYDGALPGGRGALLFDKLKDGSMFIKLESVGTPTAKSAREAASVFEDKEEKEKEYLKKSKEHRFAHIGNFLASRKFLQHKCLLKIIGKIFGKIVTDGLAYKASMKDKKEWDRKEHVPSHVKKQFKAAIKSAVKDKQEQKLLIENGLKGTPLKECDVVEKENLYLGGMSSMKRIVDALSEETRETPAIKEFQKSIEPYFTKQNYPNHGLERVGEEIIIKI